MQEKIVIEKLKIHFWGIFNLFLLFLTNGDQFSKLKFGTEGMSLGFFIIVTLYNVLIFLLTLQSFRSQKDLATKYLTLQSVCSVIISLCYVAILSFSKYEWNNNDSFTVGVALLETMVIGLLGMKKEINISKDPRIKSILAILFKPVPQFLWAWKVFVMEQKTCLALP